MAMTLEQVFGVGAVQDGSSVIIQKAAIGLSSGSNTAESILVAILKTTAASVRGNIAVTDSYYLVTENGDAISFDNSDSYNYYLELWDTALFPKNLIRYTILVNDYQPYST